jgi:molybdenum cofactor biosynthesis enzyme MoaA
MRRIRTVRKLLFNALRYRLLKYSGHPHPLEAISLEVTHRCICRCQMCNIWQIPKSRPDLPLSDWINLLSSPGLHRLRELDITGGEPFLREDLAELIKWICRSKPDYFPRLKTLAITTNGLLTDKML